MNRKKGFTLIELLAVIVILAIIALIATPVVLNIIDGAREQANERSIDMYKKALNNAVAKYMMNNAGQTPTIEWVKANVQYEGTPIACDFTIVNGKINIENCMIGDEVNSYEQQGWIFSDDNGTGKIEKKSIIKLKIENDYEEFYVISNDENQITMISKYNLYVGEKIYENEVQVINLEPRQNEAAEGYKDGIYPIVAVVSFSDNSCFTDSDEGQNISDLQQCKIYEYLREYKEKLVQYGGKVDKIRLLDEADLRAYSDTENGNFYLPTQTSFWTEILKEGKILAVTTSGKTILSKPTENGKYGVRPVITINIKDIRKEEDV